MLHILQYIIQIFKIFKLLCYLKLMIDWLPIFNPYIWPFSLLTMITSPYFSLWRKLFPVFNYNSIVFNYSIYFALEFLDIAIEYTTYLTNYLDYLINQLYFFIKYKLIEFNIPFLNDYIYTKFYN